MSNFTPKPDWLKAVPIDTNNEVISIIRELNLHTVCEEATCPNMGECFKKRTATFMIMGRHCTRNCTFCNVTKQQPTCLDQNEPANLANAVMALGLKHVVITSVTRDDLPDGGAEHFANIIETIKTLYIKKEQTPPIIEVLVPDFGGDANAIDLVLNAHPNIFGHNIETIHRLYTEARNMADYNRTLGVLKYASNIDNMFTKSGIMVGLGEAFDEVVQTMKDLRSVNCQILTIGQYLAPSKEHHPVIEYIHPDIFEQYKKVALELGFKSVASGPFVRSSYMSEDFNRSLFNSN